MKSNRTLMSGQHHRREETQVMINTSKQIHLLTIQIAFYKAHSTLHKAVNNEAVTLDKAF